MMWRGISVTTDGARDPILRVELARPERRNAMSVAMVESLFSLLDSKEAHAAGAVVIEGAGKEFCAGSDLAELAAMMPAERSVFEAECGRLARGLRAHPRPVLAAVHGFAIGGGLTLAAACDIVIAAPDAKWSLPEVPIGLFPAWGLEAVTIRTGLPTARRLAFGIDMLSGIEARAAGLADHVADDPRTTALDIAARPAELPRSQSSAVKAYFSAPRMGGDADAHANRLFMAACETVEARSSFARFGGDAGTA